jgi:lysophospholipase L1-like esterase
MPSRALDHWGLVRPYRFDRLLCLISAGALAILVLAFAVYCALTGELIRYTPREGYFIYLGVLVLAGAVLARWPWLAVVPLALATIDLSLGMGSLALKKSGLAFHSIMPRNFNEEARFEWHPLLQGVPMPSISVEVVGYPVSHSSAGTRGRDYTPEELSRKSVVAVFGGSATYDIAVSDNDTWANQLERLLGPHDFAVINHGVPGYTTVEHVIQTAFYADAFGVKPTCALYYIGWNDIRNAHIDDLDPAYARYHLRTMVDGLEVRRYGPAYRSISPLFTVIARLVSQETDTIRPPDLRGAPKSGGDPRLEAIYRRNVRSISMINRGRGIRTIWVGQILNVAVLNDDKIYGWLPFVRDKDIWPLLSQFNAGLRAEAQSLGDLYIDVSPSDFTPADFNDNGHFDEAGAVKFAHLLAPQVAAACRR